ncbi:Hypothetical protein SRM_00102 [Salinibacter ruber M8]|uniref:Uncharacterized protein n=1 Tax=Salinibacter ruber (strain M8) TaxID=761659 RepID=D5H4R8_SALRM|nr:Hypothetical protein SRM_00102 [Salinibacter ruber M8]
MGEFRAPHATGPLGDGVEKGQPRTARSNAERSAAPPTRTTTGRLVRAGRFSNAPPAGASTGPEHARGTTFAFLKGKNPSFF